MNSIGIAWSQLPDELKQRPQWCIAGPDKAPYLLGANGLYNASPVKGPWLTFEQACELAKTYNTHIGYIITKDDPYTCIDLDVKDIDSRDAKGLPYPPEKWTSQEVLNGYCAAINSFDSYAEMSASQKGVHIWVRGAVGKGIKRGGVELYSQERFIVCTGYAISALSYQISAGHAFPTVVNATPKGIADRQAQLNAAASSMVQDDHKVIELENVDQVCTDAQIYEMAAGAANADKFHALCMGRWQELGYPSQSEADLSLLSMLTFYSESNEQCRRLFRMSALGKREKAQRDDVYLNRTLRIIRSRQSREESVQTSLMEQARQLVEEIQAGKVNGALQEVAMEAPVVEKIKNDINNSTLSWPPGFTGYLAQTIYNSAPRPVKEVAIVAALGLLAGITGKAFNISQSGLNIYMILVARSAIGKEAMHSGIGAIVNRISSNAAEIHSYVNFTDFASGPALVKAVAQHTSFINITGEWGRKLKRLADDGRDGPMQQLRTVMTNLYQKSGPTSVVGGLTYSNQEQNVASISGVAYSMIGETTPGTLYESLTNSMMEDGFLSRFTIVEYDGDRPPLNPDVVQHLPDDLVEWLTQLLLRADDLIKRFAPCTITMDSRSKVRFDEFDKQCDKEINSTDDERWRQMWNRAHLKALRIAGILAAADNFVKPVVNIDHTKWAIDLIMSDIGIMRRRIEDGDVGLDDNARESKVLAVIRNFLTNTIPDSYRIPKEMQQNGVIPKRYIHLRCSRLACFTNHRMGASIAIDNVIKSLIDSGYIAESDKANTIQKYGAQGRCFQILNLN